MKTEQSIYFQTGEWIKKSDQNLGDIAQIVFLFGNKNLLKEQQRLDEVKAAYPVAEIVGCSTSGEIFGEEVSNESIICTAVWF